MAVRAGSASGSIGSAAFALDGGPAPRVGKAGDGFWVSAIRSWSLHPVLFLLSAPGHSRVEREDGCNDDGKGVLGGIRSDTVVVYIVHSSRV